MRHIIFCDDIDIFSRRLPFFLATEEWVARQLPANDYFFSWQVDPTVICGRHQDIAKEVNLQYCHKEGIDVVRRRSGGGAVFADRDNFMFSFITDGDDVQGEFKRYTNLIADALIELGLPAEATGRNDITIRGKKVAGNAFYHMPGRCIAHGTMLYNFSPKQLANALTPSRAKMESKGIKSVPSRVTSLIKEGIKIAPGEFVQFVVSKITDGEPYIITVSDIKEIERIEKGYYSKSFLRIDDSIVNQGSSFDNIQNNSSTQSRKIISHFSDSRRIENVGEICIDYDLDPNLVISNFRISGDFFLDAKISQIEALYEGNILEHDFFETVITAILNNLQN